jgi:hypothetical protein
MEAGGDMEIGTLEHDHALLGCMNLTFHYQGCSVSAMRKFWMQRLHPETTSRRTVQERIAPLAGIAPASEEPA